MLFRSADTVYLSSADMMTRNTERRVEIAYPVLDPTCRSFVVSYMNLQLADNAKARQLTAEGTWERLERAEGTPRVDSQDLLLALAYRRSRTARGVEAEALSPISVIYPTMSADQIRTLVSLPGISTYGIDDEAVAAGRDVAADADEGARGRTPSSAARDIATKLVLGETRASSAASGDTAPQRDEGGATPGGPPKGRLSRGLHLIGLGLRELFLRGDEGDG